MNPKVIEKLEPLLEKINEKNLPFVMVGCVLAIIAIDFFLILTPQLSSLGKINPKIKTISDELKATKENIDKMGYYVSQSNKLKIKFDEISARVKSREEIPIILERISRLALKYNVKIDEITPDQNNQKQLLKEKERKYYALPILIEANSDFHNFGRFLNQIETDDVILLISAFKIVSRGESRQEDIKLTLEAIVYDK
jgi:Tfp pilus assembly protein PilO